MNEEESNSNLLSKQLNFPSLSQVLFYYFGVLMGTGSVLSWAASTEWPKGIFLFWYLGEIFLICMGWILPLMTRGKKSKLTIFYLPLVLIISAILKTSLMILFSAA